MKTQLFLSVLILMSLLAAGLPPAHAAESIGATTSATLGLRGLAVLYPDGRLAGKHGRIIDVSKSPTAGIQELFNYCRDHCSDGFIMGGAEPTGGAVVYNIGAPIELPPLQGFRLDTGAVTLNFTSALGDQPGLTIDSCMMVDLRIRGQLVYAGKGYTLAFRPTRKLPIDKWVNNVIVDSSFHITTTATGPEGQGILFENPVVDSDFHFNEINGGRHGIHVKPRTLSDCRVSCRHIHGQTGVGVLTGEDNGHNIWDVSIQSDTADQAGIDTAATDDIWMATVRTRGQRPGLVLQPPASGNMFHLMQLEGGLMNKAAKPTNRIYASPNSGAGLKLGFAAETPSLPASGAPARNQNPFPVVVLIIHPGAVSSWTLGDPFGQSREIPAPLTAGQSIHLDPGESLTLRYTAAPQWVWRAVQ